jgi:hypothetical protein
MQQLATSGFSKHPILRLLLTTVLLCWGAVTHATTISYTGTFAQDDQKELISFTTSSAGGVSLRTWGFGGGINAAGDTISAGGFAPIVSVFDSSDMLIGLAQAGVATCDGNSDPVTGFCWDILLDLMLPAGNYLAVLTQDDNSPLGPFLSDGFLRDGEGNFTGPYFLGFPGSFVLVTGDQRDGHWALDISLPGNAAPEPGSLALLAGGLVALARLRRRLS